MPTRGAGCVATRSRHAPMRSAGARRYDAVGSEARSKTFGALKLTLGDGAYDWEFIPEAGKTFHDSGSGACH